MNAITLAITPGDPKGIGPEVTQKALAHLWKELKFSRVVIFSKKFPVTSKLKVEFIEPPVGKTDGFQSAWAIQTATSFISMSQKPTAMVTGPISKTNLQAAGFQFKGHTDFLALLTNTSDVTRVLANDFFKVALVTNHCALKDVSKKMTAKKIIATIERTADFCRNNLGKKKPKIAVLGLNPHAGENGILGSEELKVIIPAMKKALQNAKKKKLLLELTGPHPADSFFAMEKIKISQKKAHDVIIAQYHDQGLIPVKLSDFSNGLNLTLGLPFIRTSVDHGTAFDIAGKNKADPGSMIYAIRKAIEYL
jgi:4-hydroxythreonine-4-phosphate dehydrogenase